MFEKPFLVISSFNNSGSHLIQYGSGYQLFDQSNDPHWMKTNEKIGASRAPHVGHDLNNILNFIVDNYDSLPAKIAFLKANIIGRHCTEEFLVNNIYNDFYTNLYHDPKVELGKNVNDVPYPGMYLEANNPWYVTKENHSLYCSLDHLADRLFENYKPGKYICFGPGACFIIPRDQILRHPKDLYSALSKITTYKFFPDEAFIVERILPMIFTSGYKLRVDIFQLEDEISLKLNRSSHKCLQRAPQSRIKRKLVHVLECIREVK